LPEDAIEARVTLGIDVPDERDGEAAWAPVDWQS
jgi:hypothetical protein